MKYSFAEADSPRPGGDAGDVGLGGLARSGGRQGGEVREDQMRKSHRRDEKGTYFS